MTPVKLSDSSVPIEQRVAHAKALGQSKDATKALNELLPALTIADEDLRNAIVAALKQQKADVVLLLRATDTKKPAAERASAFAGLRALKPAGAAPTIAALLDPAKEKDEAVRADAAHALCVFGTAEAEAALVKSLASEPSANVRYFVATALGELKTKPAKDAVAARAKVETDFATQDALEQAQAKQNRP